MQQRLERDNLFGIMTKIKEHELCECFEEDADIL